MSTLLLLIIYITFIGLGIPDSLFGTAWPSIQAEFALPVSWAGIVTLIISGCTILSSLLSGRMVLRFGTGRVAAFSTMLTVIALFGFTASQGMIWLCLAAIPLGFGAGAIDAALNNFVATHYAATHMSFLHCFYGVGVTASPFLLSMALAAGTWRSGYRMMSLLQFGIGILTIVALPLWKKVGDRPVSELENAGRIVPYSELLSDPAVLLSCLGFIGSCALEFTCGSWGSTFLVNAKGLSVESAARIVTLYYLGMTLGRFFSGILCTRLSSRAILFLGQGIALAAILLLLFAPSVFAASLGMFLIGMGNGPVYPNMLHLTPHRFGIERSQSVMGLQMASAYIGILAAPALFGIIAQHLSIHLFAPFLLIWYAIMMLSHLQGKQ